MPINVLVVDDSAVMRSMIIRSLKLGGLPVARVHEARDGQEALSMLEDHWIDLALVDINMPVMDGEEMLNHMRDVPHLADVPVVVVSTEGSDTRIAQLKALGAEFVHKPFSPETLRQVIIRLTGVEQDGTFDCGPVAGAAPGGSLDF